MLREIVSALWLLAPAYAANAVPPLAKGKIPMDFGRKMPDGNRILGDGKTIEGFSAGVLAGTAVGLAEAALSSGVPGLPEMTPLTAFLLSFGAMLGDSCGSFIKRRLGMERGEEAVLLDQLDFVLGAAALYSLVSGISPLSLATMLLLTPIIHRLANILGYRLGIKKVPW